jgi:hypothetical protein
VELAELAQNYFGDTRSGSLAGPVGGFIIAALAVVTVLLIRNMNARLRRLPDRFPEPSPSSGRVGTKGGITADEPATTHPDDPDPEHRTG